MPLATLLTTVLVTILGNAIARLLLGAGLAFVTYQALDGYVEGFLVNFVSSMQGLPADMFAILVILGVPVAFEILGSAMLTVAAIRLTDRVVGVKITG